MTFKEHFRTNFNIRLQIADKKTELNSILRGEILKDFMSETGIFKFNQIEIKADPFLFVHNETLYLFYEEKLRMSKGYIMMTSTRDLKSWSDPVLVLQESFHLSFPFVFAVDDDVYLMPETGEVGEIRLYRFSDETLTKVELVKVLMKGEFVDSSIISIDGEYYLFTSDSEFKQRVFVADNLLGDYNEHPSSPIYIGSDYGRNAGAVFEYGGFFYRPSQDCSRLYGDNVSLHQLKEFTTDLIEEKPYIKNLFNRDNSFYTFGGHQFNIVEFKNKLIVATDALDLNFNIFKIAQKLLNKVFHFDV